MFAWMRTVQHRCWILLRWLSELLWVPIWWCVCMDSIVAHSLLLLICFKLMISWWWNSFDCYYYCSYTVQLHWNPSFVSITLNFFAFHVLWRKCLTVLFSWSFRSFLLTVIFLVGSSSCCVFRWEQCLDNVSRNSDDGTQFQ